jgi:ribosomal protein S4
MILKKKTYVSYVEKALKGKLGRGFLVNYLGYLEGRLMVIAYRLNLINNVFIIKNAINAGFFHINQKKKKHINTRMNLGDILQIGKK